MKRSEINREIKKAEEFFAAHGFKLPAFASWTPAEWARHGAEIREIVDCNLGWDLTDFGRGNFAAEGLLLFTIRNGVAGDSRYPKPYAEKIMISRSEQVTLTHCHETKCEDIINRGGGNILIRVYNSHPDESVDYESDVTVHTDGRTYTVPAGTQIRLTPGESIFIQQYLYHDFEVEPGTGNVLLGEVSQCNDDANDNRFNPVLEGRFPAIEEDEAPYRLLCTEYPAAK